MAGGIMPLVFIFSGCCLIFILCGFYHRNFPYKFPILLMLSSIMLSFYPINVSFGRVGINFFALLSIIISFVFLVSISKPNLLDFALIVVVPLIYKSLISNTDNLLACSNFPAKILVFSFSLAYIFNIKKSLFFVVSSYLLIIALSSSVELDNFGYSFVNIYPIFDLMLAVFCCYCIFYNYRFIFSTQRRRDFGYEKKDFSSRYDFFTLPTYK